MATDAGTTLENPYDQDMDGEARGAVGVWDRGAYEYIGGGAPPGAPFARNLVMTFGSLIGLWVLLPCLFSFALFAGYTIYRMRLTLKNHDSRIRFIERGNNF